MPFGLSMGTDRAAALQRAIEDELVARGYSLEADPVMAEYICIMVINNKAPAMITGELQDLIGSDFDNTFTDWLFQQAAKGAPEGEPVTAPEPAPVAAPEPPAARDAPPPAFSDNAPRRPPSGPRTGVYQAALNQALPGSSAQKRTASARSPSPGAHPPKTRRTDLPTGPRAMRDGPGGGPQGGRSLLDRVGPAPPRRFDEVQARIDSITGAGPAGAGPDPSMMMAMQQGGFHPGMMQPGMDMGNPLMLQEMMMNQMALMAQMATNMGILNPATGQFGGFPQQGMGGEMGHMGSQIGGRGGPRGRGRGGLPGRGRGGHMNGGDAGRTQDAESAPTTAPTPATTVAAPTPIPAVLPNPASQARTGFVPPERPQSPTLCKFGPKCTNPTCRYSHPSPVATAESGVVLSNDPCEKGINCTDADCVKGHVSPAVKNGSTAEHLKPSNGSSPAAMPCRYGAACTRQGAGCPYLHPRAPSASGASTGNHFATPCRFGSGCTRASCPFQHPADRTLPGTFYRGLGGDAPLVSVKAPEPGTVATNGGHNRSMTFNKAATGGAPVKAGSPAANVGAGKGANAQEELAQKMKEIEERKREVAVKEQAMATKKAEGKATPAVVGTA